MISPPIHGGDGQRPEGAEVNYMFGFPIIVVIFLFLIFAVYLAWRKDDKNDDGKMK